MFGDVSIFSSLGLEVYAAFEVFPGLQSSGNLGCRPHRMASRDPGQVNKAGEHLSLPMGRSLMSSRSCLGTNMRIFTYAYTSIHVCVYVHMCACVNLTVHLYTCTYIHTYESIQIGVICMYTCTHTSIYPSLFLSACVYTHTHIYIYIQIHACINVNMHICICTYYIYIYAHVEV